MEILETNPLSSLLYLASLSLVFEDCSLKLFFSSIYFEVLYFNMLEKEQKIWKQFYNFMWINQRIMKKLMFLERHELSKSTMEDTVNYQKLQQALKLLSFIVSPFNLLFLKFFLKAYSTWYL